MPSIKPISDLSDYMEVLWVVVINLRVFVTRYGHGAYIFMTIEEADALDKLRSMAGLLSDLKKADNEASEKGWIDSDDLEKELGIYD